ncbi:MAG: hypothetical protein ACREA0_18745, partial [bacterium]
MALVVGAAVVETSLVVDADVGGARVGAVDSVDLLAGAEQAITTTARTAQSLLIVRTSPGGRWRENNPR